MSCWLRRDRSHFPVEISVVARRRGERWQFNVFVADIKSASAARSWS
jgi:hypothetical protein